MESNQHTNWCFSLLCSIFWMQCALNQRKKNVGSQFGGTISFFWFPQQLPSGMKPLHPKNHFTKSFIHTIGPCIGSASHVNLAWPQKEFSCGFGRLGSLFLIFKDSCYLLMRMNLLVLITHHGMPPVFINIFKSTENLMTYLNCLLYKLANSKYCVAKVN